LTRENFFEIRKFKKILKKFKKNKNKLIADTWHVLLKNVNYLNTVSQNDQIDQNLTKMRT